MNLQEMKKLALSACRRLKDTPVWFALPSLAMAGAIGLTIAGYSPLVFDPSLYPSQSALASELTTIDADSIESGESQRVEAGSVGDEKLKDGTYTGYAACGEGNPDDWKPYYVAVTIEVKDGKVTAITNIAGTSSTDDGSPALSWDAAENQEYLDLAIDGHGGSGVKAQMESQIQAQGKVTGIDTVSGATYSSTAIYNAYANAIGKAGGKAESKAAPSASGTSATSKKVSKKKTSANLADGSWTGFAACGKGNTQNWKPYYVAVTVKVKNGKALGITKIAGRSTGEGNSARLSWDPAENQKYLTWAASGHNGFTGVKTQVNKQLKAKGSVSGIDTVSGATYSSEAIYDALASALNKSAKAAGSKTKAVAKKKPKQTDKPRVEPVQMTNEIPTGTLADGSWQAFVKCGPDPDQDWKPYYIGVTLSVKDGKLASLDSIFGSSTGEEGDEALYYDAAENDDYLQGAISVVGDKLKASAAAGIIPTTVDTVSGATYSSRSLNEAFFAALRKAAAAGGASIEEPAQTSEDQTDNSHEADQQAEPQGGGQGEEDQQEAPSGDGPAAADDGEDDSPAEEQSITTHYGYAFCQAAESSWDSYYIFVEISALDGKATKINRAFGDTEGIVDPAYVYNAGQNAVYLDWAIDGKFAGTGYRMKSVVKQIQAKIDANAAVSGIQTVSGATRSSNAIIAAYENAVANAAAGLGATPEAAVQEGSAS